jgi:hypothetical protein
MEADFEKIWDDRLNIQELVHLEMGAERNKDIEKKINKWICDFMDNGEDMDAYWQDSLKRLIYEIKLTPYTQ